MAWVMFGDVEERVSETPEQVLNACAQAEHGIRIGGRRVSPGGWINLTAVERDQAGSDQLYVQVSSISWVRESA